ncbi:putative membrane protein [Rhodoblastus acidophilus]|uniref:TPM domain-containing protein n=1 Tax=Rhodoblastus acidophilus TaxID=1074 RepID=UPI0022250F3F|nr:TPM domain-containing protein [Rhodoblastus acidophilus]MCW2285230.1 putative membrane protein [Rhodoblastus acidophilus]MCW2334186.1 putative membrane protein [Rhodoblastus acidophilus]
MRQTVDEAAIAAAVHRAEARTSGQIVCVLAKRSCDGHGQDALYAGVLAMLTPWPLLAATHWSAQAIFTLQLAIFVIALAVLHFTPLGATLASRAEKRRQAFRSATEQFFARGVGRTESRAGVLIFVSLAERYARILPDEGLAEKISEDEWREVVALLTDRLRAGQVTEAFVAAIDRCGALLERAAPGSGGDNELPDGLIQLDK